MKGELHLPWATPPNDMGGQECAWCHRCIYLPAVPCSVRPVDGLLLMKTAPGQGDRCKYELITRHPELMKGLLVLPPRSQPGSRH